MKEPASLVRELAETRARTDALFAMIRPDSLYERPIPERHRLVFYLGHLEAFDWNLICRGELSMAPFQADFDQLFAFGIDPPAGQLPNDTPSDWPPVNEVLKYNARVRRALDEVLNGATEEVLHIAVEHRLMHAETFAYILHSLAPDRKVSIRHRLRSSGPVPVHTQITIPEGTATLGRRRRDGFGWDNEFEAQAVTVPTFAISKYKVTNRQYLEFLRAGANPPHFWTRRGDEWFWRTMFGEVPLPLDWPVYVTYEQARSYAEWVGKSLPTEVQFHRAAYGTPGEEERAYPWGGEAPTPHCGNFNFYQWDPIPVTASPQGDSAFGVSQLVGNGWEWTTTEFHPFHGFQPYPLYPGYSARFFDGSHRVVKGGSSQTATRLLRCSFRNWFRPQYPYVYAGFRCVKN